MRLSVLVPLLLIFLIVAAGACWVYSGASRAPGTATGPGGTSVSVAGAAGAATTPTRRPASAAGAAATPAAGAAAPAPTLPGGVQLASNEILYQVRQGDTLWGIAMAYNTTVSVIVQRNNIPNPSLIYVGQRIIVPKGVVPTPTPSGQVVYFVTWGDTLWEIAQRYGTTVDAIAAANSICNPDRIYVGQRLVIPLPTVG